VPERRPKGTNTTTVVSVELTMGPVISSIAASRAPAPLSALNQELWRAAALDAAADASVSELVRWVERMARIEIAPATPRP
jgi:hypothetical protein